MNARRIGFWLLTGLVALVSTGSSIGYLTGAMDASIQALDLPLYFSKILAFWKLSGVIALLSPVFADWVAKVKEWAYAGFFFNLTGAFACHIAVGHRVDAVPALVVLCFLVGSYRLQDAR